MSHLKKEKILKKILFTIFSFLSVLAFSQVLGSKLDKKTLALGEVGIYKVNISNLQGKDVQSSPKNELLAALQAAHGKPVNADSPVQQHKSALVADAERRAQAGS